MGTSDADEARDYNTTIIKEFRANQGHVGGPWAGTTLILIHHVGARSGIEHVTPVAVLADELDGAARAKLWPKLVAEFPGQLDAAQAKTTRQFPLFVLTRQD